MGTANFRSGVHFTFGATLAVDNRDLTSFRLNVYRLLYNCLGPATTGTTDAMPSSIFLRRSFAPVFLVVVTCSSIASATETTASAPPQREQHNEAALLRSDQPKTWTYEKDQQTAAKPLPIQTAEERSMRRFLTFMKEHEGAVVALGTVALVVVTLLLATATAFLWWATRALVKGAELTAESQLRAYLSYPIVEIINFGTNDPIEALLTVKNCGQTPAYDVRDFVAIKIAKYPNHDFCSPELGPSSASLGPGDGGFTRLKLANPLTTSQVRDILAGEWAIYVIGEVRYWDAFRKKERFTRYRGFYRGTGDLAFVPNKPLELRHTEVGNDSN